MLSKKTFVGAIESIEKQMKLDCELNHQLAKMDNMSSLWLTDKMMGVVTLILDEVMGCEKIEHVGTDIDYFMYEHNFGKRKSPFCEIGKKKIYVKNASQLYDYINKGKK